MLGEPGFIGEIYKNSKAVPDPLKSLTIKTSLACWGQWAEKQNKFLILKLSSYLIRFADRIQADFPPGKRLFLYREPIAVIESLAHRPPNYIRRTAKKEAAPNSPSIETLASVAANYYLELLKHYTKAQHSMLMPVDYCDLETKFKDIVHFFSPTHHDTSPIWSSVWQAKSQTKKKKRYKPRPTHQLTEFYDAHRDILTPLLQNYKNLKQVESTTATKPTLGTATPAK